MKKKEYHVIGVMSGTSLDGIDLAYIKFSMENAYGFKIIHCETVSYFEEWQLKLKNLITFSSEELQEIDKQYTRLLASVINAFIQKNNITEIVAICSHGHTALHQPEKGLTYQIGNLPELALITKKQIVCDFRVQDVALGGQGAPLVPIGDKLLFGKYDFCVNLGGFANISSEVNNLRLAYDICPVNIVLNHYTERLGFSYDDKGMIASSGEVHQALLKDLNNLEFYNLQAPKSLGLEWVKKVIFPIIDAYNMEVRDVLRTFVEHIAIQITYQINKKENASVLVTGGGAFNLYLIKRIKDLTGNEIIIPSEEIINYKEALIFGLLGVLKLREEANCLSSVTGAKHDHSSGKIYIP
ncbi:anhydro-N-acetylmuramic acid kinase [Oceanihabitans sediminis]|uniref:Anhydro-N-acetylmuramic acid kinase n=1 Tax=Oceanihabitans sediminis TaxID=1812012 RepID=A0A368P341_9FLAO|nr:anhydro-N-acetylmuramic acid kinase [Oceanihabitans sediminis]MDX1279396.1 anhydro-N-acetylmuramic acid kinase [Oceanihabitans sediminis]RBP29958.1 anhydro-N-acetylmuramic acid kinase [Oceanihabitans sediminis]RCU57287.1 anhydro-N-acetylmuramic acid kinase [Oceanihabitans sediminis]